MGAELPDAVVAAVLLVVEAGAEELDEVLAVVVVCAEELATVFPAVGIATPILLASAAAVRANRARKSPAPAVGFEAVPGAAAGNPAPENELIEVM
ncbi:MAG: hypothetical protein ACLQVN_27615 [Bryobacteraceae bacterium]